MAVLVIAQGLLTQSFAQTPPSELARVPAVSETGVRPTADIRLGALRIQFEETGLQTIGPEMHNVVIHHAQPKGDERGYSWLCFTVVRHSRAERWWLMSDDEFGGAPDFAITGIFAERLKPSAVPTAACPEPPPQFLPASLDDRVWVGSQAAAIKSAFGSEPPSNGWHRYSNVGKQIDSSHGKAEEWTVQSWLDVKLKAGVVVALRAVQMSSS